MEYLIEELLISNRWAILVLCVPDENNQSVFIEMQASSIIYNEIRTESEMGKIPVKLSGTALGIVWSYYLEIIETH